MQVESVRRREIDDPLELRQARRPRLLTRRRPSQRPLIARWLVGAAGTARVLDEPCHQQCAEEECEGVERAGARRAGHEDRDERGETAEDAEREERALHAGARSSPRSDCSVATACSFISGPIVWGLNFARS